MTCSVGICSSVGSQPVAAAVRHSKSGRPVRLCKVVLRANVAGRSLLGLSMTTHRVYVMYTHARHAGVSCRELFTFRRAWTAGSFAGRAALISAKSTCQLQQSHRDVVQNHHSSVTMSCLSTLLDTHAQHSNKLALSGNTTTQHVMDANPSCMPGRQQLKIVQPASNSGQLNSILTPTNCNAAN